MRNPISTCDPTKSASTLPGNIRSNAGSYSHDIPFANFVESRYGVGGAHAQCYTDDTQSNAHNARGSDMSRGVMDHVVDAD